MIKKYLSHLLIAFFILANQSLVAQQSLHYDFHNTLDEKNGQAPALNPLGTGSFVNESLPDLSCLERSAYSFTQNSGVQFDNATGNNIIGISYTIEMYFKFIDNTGFMRIIDYKNRTSDFGLYATSTILQFYDEITIGTNAFAANQYVYLVLTRDGSTEDVNIYLDGSLIGTFNDVNGSALLDASNVLNFFQDDLVFGGEARPGTIALLKLYDTPLDAPTVLDNFNKLESTSGVVAFSPDILSTCLTNNVFNFTNESATTSTVTYTWEFGDGNGTTGVDASHSYSTDGFFDVLLIADDGAGCVDSTTVTVEVYLSPLVDLGADFDICDGDFAILDAGPGFASYLWNDSTTNSTLIVNQAGTYTVEVSDPNGCTGTAQIQIGILAPPVVELGADTILCFGESIQLLGPPNNFSYTWSTGEFTQNITVNSAGVYSVEVVDFDGCSAIDSIAIDINPELTVTLPAFIFACDGDTVILDPGPGFTTFFWSDFSTDSILLVTASGFYSVEVTDSLGCAATSNIADITFEPIPVVDLGNDITICGGTPVVLDAGPGFNTYEWNDGSFTQTISVSTGGTYTVTVSNIAGCTASDEIVIDADPFVTLGNDQTVCEGDTITLDPGPGYTTYLWSNGTTGQTLVVTETDIYTLTVTDINGCINSTQVEITFNAPPVVDLGADINLCDGEIAVLDAGPAFSTYLWSDASAGQTLNVTVGGTYTVTVTDNAGCEGTDDITVTVVPLPVVDLGFDQDLCDGSTFILDAGSGMTVYEWSDGSSLQTLMVSLAGTYTVTVTDANGCSGSDDITITLISAPVVTLGADTILCDGEQITLDAGGGFSSYLWNDSSIMQTLDVITSGIYSVTVTDANGCTGVDEIEIDYYAPVPTPTISQNGNTLISSAPFGNQWYEVPGGLIPGATSNTYDPGQDGTFYVVVTDVNGCVSPPSADYVFIFVGISDVPEFSFMMAPNPANDIITIQSSGTFNSYINVELIDVIGKVVFTGKMRTGMEYKLSLAEYKQCVYFVRLSSANHVATRKLIISR